MVCSFIAMVTSHMACSETTIPVDWAALRINGSITSAPGMMAEFWMRLREFEGPLSWDKINGACWVEMLDLDSALFNSLSSFVFVSASTIYEACLIYHMWPFGWGEILSLEGGGWSNRH